MVESIRSKLREEIVRPICEDLAELRALLRDAGYCRRGDRPVHTRPHRAGPYAHGDEPGWAGAGYAGYAGCPEGGDDDYYQDGYYYEPAPSAPAVPRRRSEGWDRRDGYDDSEEGPGAGYDPEYGAEEDGEGAVGAYRYGAGADGAYDDPDGYYRDGAGDRGWAARAGGRLAAAAAERRRVYFEDEEEEGWDGEEEGAEAAEDMEAVKNCVSRCP